MIIYKNIILHVKHPKL